MSSDVELGNAQEPRVRMIDRFNAKLNPQGAAGQQPSGNDWRAVAAQRTAKKAQDWREIAAQRQQEKQAENVVPAPKEAPPTETAAPQKTTEQGFLQSVKSAVTGEGRKDPNIPEFDLPFELSGRQAKTALGLMTTFDDKREMAILRENYPDLKFSEDENGNVLVDGSAYGGGVGYLNKPGISLRDIADVGFQIGAFTPSGKAGAAVTKLIPRMAAVGGAASGTQAAIDIAGQATGATEDVSVRNIKGGDVVAAGLGGAVFEALGTIAAKMLPSFRKNRVISDKIRNEFKKAAEQQGINPAQVSDDMIASFMDMAAESVDPKAMAATKAGKEFGIRYTKGQSLNDLQQLNLEDSFRHGALGDKAEKTMQQFYEKTQAPSIRTARAATQAKIAGGRPAIESPVGMGEVVREGVKAKAAALDDTIGQAYEAVGDAYLSPEGMSKLTDTVIGSAKDFIKDPDLAPATMKLISEAKKFKDFLGRGGAKLKPMHLSRIETMRRKIGAYIDAAKNPTDRRQVTIMKRQFDGFIDDAVDNALFSGDETAIEALKKARGLRAEYAKKFQRRDIRLKSGRKVKDDAGEVMERMVSADPTDEQVVNYIFGASKIGGKQAGPKIAKKIKDSLGADSKEWQAIREAAFLKLTAPAKGSDVTSGRVFLSRLDEAMRDSPTLMKELFSAEEQKMMRRLAVAIKRAQPDPKNPSKTAYKLSSIIRQQADEFLRLMGWTMGGIKGRMGAEGVIKGKGMLGGIRAAKDAQKAVEGISRPLKRLNIGGVGAVASVQSQQ